MAEQAVYRGEVHRLLMLVIAEPEQLPTLDPAQLDMCLRLARRARLLGRLAGALDAAALLDDLPEIAADQLRSSLVMADARTRMALWELDRIARAVQPDESTPLIALKGCAYLLLDLPHARGRIFADVDLMTAEEQLESVEARLNARGWETALLTPYDDHYYRRWTHELPPLKHVEREMEIDLHHNLLPRTARLKPDARKLLASSRAVSGSRYRVLASEDMVLHAMTHLTYADDLADKLRELVDIADLIDHFTEREPGFWDRFLQRTPELDLARPAFYALRYLHRLLGKEIPTRVREEARAWGPPAPVRGVMDRLAPRALLPQHPDHHSRLTEAARVPLYLRSHWIRMPPWLLAYHLSYKFAATRLRRRRQTD